MRSLILLIGVLFISTGCVGLPGPESFDRDYGDKPKGNVRTLLGEPGSDKPVRVGQTREQLPEILGTPDMRSADNSTESYEFRRHHGFVFGIIPLGHFWGNQTPYDDFYLVLRFDPRERLASWEFGKEVVRLVADPADYHHLHWKAGDTQMFYIDREKGWPTTQPG